MSGIQCRPFSLLFNLQLEPGDTTYNSSPAVARIRLPSLTACLAVPFALTARNVVRDLLISLGPRFGSLESFWTDLEFIIAETVKARGKMEVKRANIGGRRSHLHTRWGGGRFRRGVRTIAAIGNTDR